MSVSNITEIVRLINSARKAGIILFAESGKLRYKIEQGTTITPEWLQTIKNFKEEILHFIESGQKELGEKERPALRIAAGSRPSRIPLSYSQERLWFIDQLEGSLPYHIPMVVRMRGELDHGRMEAAFRSIVERHEILRTVFSVEDGLVSQQVQGSEGWTLGIIRNSECRENAQLLGSVIDEQAAKPFDLSKDYMLRTDLIELGDNEYVMVMVIHHIASDGWSMPLLVNELRAFYVAHVEGKEAGLPALPLQYADYAIWQRENLQGEVACRRQPA
jgi:hypothetical protein